MICADIELDIERIIRVCHSRGGVNIDRYEALNAWKKLSDMHGSRWMFLPQDDYRLFASIRGYLPGGEFYDCDKKCKKCDGSYALSGMAYCLRCTRETIDWLRQTVHRATHDGPLDECRKITCDAALKALGKR